MKIPWIVQSNVGPFDDVISVKEAVKERGNPCCTLSASPSLDNRDEFTREYSNPAFEKSLDYIKRCGVDPHKPAVWQGGIGFIEAARKRGLSSWIFTDKASFNLRMYLEKWGSLMLNSEGSFTTIGGFLDLPGSPDELVFIRPVKDLKEFPGNVIPRIDFRRWVGTIQGRGFNLDETCEIYVGSPYGISHEWRLFLVDGKVASGSYYTSEKYSSEASFPPKDVIEFGEQAASIWSPAPIFCLDVCKSAGNLYIVEAGSFHSAGLYKTNVPKVVEAISSYFENKLGV